MENIEREARKEIKAIPLSDGQTNVFVCKNGTPHETCVACGDVIPEGRQVCPNCEGGDEDETSI